MNFKFILTTSFILKSIFVLSLFLLIFISGISIKHTVALTESNELLVQSYKIQIELDHILSSLKEAESAQRGYIISNDPEFFADYNSGRDKIKQSFELLQKLTVENPLQHRSIDSLQLLISYRFALLAISLEMILDPKNKDLLDENLLKGQKLMDTINSQVNQMITSEMDYFKQHEEKYEYENKLTPLFNLMIFVFSLIVFVLSFYKIIKDYENLKKTNRELQITTESFSHAEKIGKFCITHWDLEKNKITFSNNLFLLLGCPPQSFPSNIENYLKFVHPDDRHIVSTGAEKVIKGKITYPRYYRIYRKDGEMRYFKSIGKFISYEKGKMHISIITDITQQHLINQALEERNHDLEQSIKELDSFNRVASHDLQEPLRKIQTLISRFSEIDKKSLSEAGQEQINKIEKSAKRMRILIDDLLLYSRTTKTEKIFNESDLNIILEDVKLELAADIEDKQVIIHSANLPVLKVIAFQIHQLFMNLFSNSIKYKRPGISPIIKIDYEKINAIDYPVLISPVHKWYHKISITDNGMGFEQQYSENIFTLFQRLNPKSDYPGSGIGLSICKKIIENHNGYIIAEGRPGFGSTFTLFLP